MYTSLKQAQTKKAKRRGGGKTGKNKNNAGIFMGKSLGVQGVRRLQAKEKQRRIRGDTRPTIKYKN